MIPGAAHRSPGIYLTAEEKVGKCHLEDSLMKAVSPIISSNNVGRIAKLIREKEPQILLVSDLATAHIGA